MITMQQERFTDMVEELKPIIPQHWAEVTGSGPPLDPAWDVFLDLDTKNLVRVLTVRSDAELVGYLIFIICPALHYQTIKLAHDDAFYLKPEHRKGTLGIRMFKEAEKMLAADGVDRIMYHEKHKAPMGRILEYLDYTPKETIWFKDLT